MLQGVTLVLGGAASGKSAVAENMIVNSGLNPVYLATSQVRDQEMVQKVALHRDRRGPEWSLREVPVAIGPVLRAVDPGAVVLLDCATMWLTNVMLGDHDMEQEQAALFDAIDAMQAPLVIVSNEVGQGIVPENALARQFREAQGRLNIALAARADIVVHVVAGLPNVLKGQMQ